MTADHKENGTEKSLNLWWSNSEKADTQFSGRRVHCPEERSKAREVENYQYISAPMETRLKLFFAQLFLLMRSVSTEQSQMCVRKTVLVKQVRRDPCWTETIRPIVRASKIINNSTYTFDWEFLHKKIYFRSVRNEWKGFHNQINWYKMYWCRIPENSWRRTVLHDRRHWRILIIYRNSGLSWVHSAKRRRSVTTKRWDSRKHQNWTRIWKSQPVTCKVNMEWKSELNL